MNGLISVMANVKYEEAIKRGAVGVITLNMSLRNIMECYCQAKCAGCF